MRLSENKKAMLKKLAKKYDLELILLFGSYASGLTHKQSDMDIAVLFDRKKRKSISLDEELEIAACLTKIFNKKIDLSIANHANPLLLKQIYFNCCLLFGAMRAFNAFRLYAFHRFNDYAPYFAREARAVGAIIKKL